MNRAKRGHKKTSTTITLTLNSFAPGFIIVAKHDSKPWL